MLKCKWDDAILIWIATDVYQFYFSLNFFVCFQLLQRSCLLRLGSGGVGGGRGMSTSAGKIMIFHHPTEVKLSFSVQKVATFGQAPRRFFLCSFPGSYYCCWEETEVLFSFSFFHPSEILRPLLALRHYAAKLVDGQIVPAIGELGHFHECRQRRPSSCLGAAFDGRTSGPSRSFRAPLIPVSVVFIGCST